MLEDIIICAAFMGIMWAIPTAVCWVCQLFAKPATHHPNGWQRLDRPDD